MADEPTLLCLARRVFGAGLALWLLTVIAASATGWFFGRASAATLLLFAGLASLAVVLFAASVALEATADFIRWRREAGSRGVNRS